MSQPTLRRLVLLPVEAGGEEVVLAEPPAERCIEEMRRLVKENPGRRIAAEWLHSDGQWMRWIVAGGEIDRKYWSKKEE